MSEKISDKKELPIRSEDDIVTVRQYVKELAIENGFDSFATAAITTAASELSRNIWVHAKEGLVSIAITRDVGDRTGLRLEFTDHGPGIVDLDRALAGGYSTAKSLGLGLSGSKRLVDDFQIDTRINEGTKVVITKWKRLF